METTSKIKEFLDRKLQEVKLDLLPLNDYAEILFSLGFNTKQIGPNNTTSINLAHEGNEFDTNGWRVDFWWTVYHNKERFVLSGSLFYGEITLSRE